VTTYSSNVATDSSIPEETMLQHEILAPERPERSAGMFSQQTTLGGVLVIDDEPDVRKVIRMTLEKAGYFVVEAENGEQAMAAMNEGEHPMVLDVILTDIRMPKVDGVEAIHYFQREYPSVPLIVLTAFPDLEMATGLLKHGIIDYLVKPVERGKLLTAVANALERRRINWF